jgi:hypothetical protein
MTFMTSWWRRLLGKPSAADADSGNEPDRRRAGGDSGREERPRAGFGGQFIDGTGVTTRTVVPEEAAVPDTDGESRGLPDLLEWGREYAYEPSGQFGYDRDNPILGHGGWYGRHLRCPAGHAFYYHRLGAVGPGPDGHTLDAVELLCFGGECHLLLYIDFYHDGPWSRVPDGLRLGTPAGVGDTRGMRPDFPAEFERLAYEAAAERLRAALNGRSDGPAMRAVLQEIADLGLNPSRAAALARRSPS